MIHGQNRIHIVIIEDNISVRDGLEFLVSSQANYFVVNTYSKAEDGIANLKKDKPDIILMDIELPKMNGIKAIKIIKKEYPHIEILVFSIHESSEIVFEALCAGAVGYITKVSNYDKIINAIEDVLKGGSPMSTQIARMVVSTFNRNQKSPLSGRETEILEQLASGKSHTRIAEDLFLSKETIRTHMRNIYNKLQVNSKADAIAAAKTQKLI